MANSRPCFVEHACIEPDAGFARRVGDRIEVQACTQAPYMDRDDIAAILGIAPEAVRIIPTAVGGGFGSKLDLSVQPFIAFAAWLVGLPVRMVYTRPEVMRATTKRHPAKIRVAIGANRDGRLTAMSLDADFNTGAYASFGPDRRQPRAGARIGTLPRSQLPRRDARRAHKPRAGGGVSRLRRAAIDDRAGAGSSTSWRSDSGSTRSTFGSATP